MKGLLEIGFGLICLSTLGLPARAGSLVDPLACERTAALVRTSLPSVAAFERQIMENRQAAASHTH